MRERQRERGRVRAPFYVWYSLTWRSVHNIYHSRYGLCGPVDLMEGGKWEGRGGMGSDGGEG